MIIQQQVKQSRMKQQYLIATIAKMAFLLITTSRDSIKMWILVENDQTRK